MTIPMTSRPCLHPYLRPGFPRALFRWGMPRAEQVDPDVLLDPDTGNTFLNAKFNFYVSSEVSGNHYVLDYVV